MPVLPGAVVGVRRYTRKRDDETKEGRHVVMTQVSRTRALYECVVVGTHSEMIDAPTWSKPGQVVPGTTFVHLWVTDGTAVAAKFELPWSGEPPPLGTHVELELRVKT